MDGENRGWTVTHQREVEEMVRSGQFVRFMRVSAETPFGVEFTVDVPLQQYDPETVAAVLDAKAEKINAVSAL